MEHFDLAGKLRQLIDERRAYISGLLMAGNLKDMETYKYLQGELRALDLVEEEIINHMKEAR
tara:strand:- start:3081 stop:3266 length:186 start_codon:yes stop_codon:yes gene_type:complete